MDGRVQVQQTAPLVQDKSGQNLQNTTVFFNYFQTGYINTTTTERRKRKVNPACGGASLFNKGLTKVQTM